MKKIFIIYIFLILSLLLKAQTGNIWTFANQTGLDFNFDPPKTIESRIDNMYCGSVSDSLGKLLFYTNGEYIWNNDNNLTDSFYSRYDYDKFSLGTFCATILPTNKLNEFLIIQGIQYQKKPQPFVQKVVSSLYRFNPFTKSGTFISKNLFVDTLGIRFKVKQSKKPGVAYEIFGYYQLQNKVMIYEVDTFNTITLKKTIPFFRNGLGVQIENINAIAHHSDYLFLGYLSLVQDTTPAPADSVFFDFYSYDSIYNFKLLNRIDRKGSGPYLLFKDSLVISISPISDATFSPNDSLLYLRGEINFNTLKRKDGIIQWDIFNPSVYYYKLSNQPVEQLGQGFKLGPNGKIYTIPQSSPFVSIVNNPDSKGAGCNIKFNALSVANSWNNGVTGTNYFPTTFFTYQRVQFDYVNTCEGIAFYNRSDTGIFKTFTWFFNDTDSFVQALPHTQRWGSTPAVAYDFNTKGTYLVKLKATKASGYNIWWSNDVNFTPLKPHAKFTTQSAQGCQYIAYQFNDSSSSDTISPTGYSYYWDYGDGTKEEMKNVQSEINHVKHIYTVNGTFTVRLIFSNGFCNDTFSIVNNVVILPAPKPGFALNNHNGCVPFSLKVSDTLKSTIVLKEYDFGSGFVALKNNAILDTTLQMIIPGTYIIKQRLTGTTGCITEFADTVEILNGIKNGDTVKVFYTTVLNSTTTKTVWKTLPNAISYSINNKNIRDTFFIDGGATPKKKKKKYFIYANDTCGNRSAISLVAQTIYLKGENKNFNEFALLHYTPYETWQQGVFKYEIEFFNTVAHQWELLSTLNPTIFNYNANVLPATNGIVNDVPEICYRIIAVEDSGNKQVSISNEACVPIYPVVFLPNAFSPNGDGLNDYYKPICSGLNSYIFEIYNRWGELMYSDTPVNKGWDGMFRGEKMEAGLYVYRLSAIGYLKSQATNEARVVERKGTLFLVR
ncbi:MAG: gliding motility-associated C-terminal domain-containing protein [Bacteroidetes bacterium]|nr:gliding motility-associated C-terminal domain-containing protein [Bacteroidota bacterium]